MPEKKTKRARAKTSHKNNRPHNRPSKRRDHRKPSHDNKSRAPREPMRKLEDLMPEPTAPQGELPTDFRSMGLARPILEAVHIEGYTTPTPIQAQAIPPIMAGCDVLGCAQTGTGKTAAFALPILHRLLTGRIDKDRREVHPRALILSPTRELAAQIDESFAAYGYQTGLSGAVIYGGVSQFHQVKALRRGVDVLVATPGRLIDLMDQGLVSLHAIEIFVLDEADRMLDMGFIHPIRQIASAIENENRQTLLFSATMPKQIRQLADSLLTDPVRVTIAPRKATTELIDQSVYMIHRKQKRDLLLHLLEDEGVARAVVFTRTKHGADKVARHLDRSGVSSDAIHGNKAQNQRQRALDRFREGRTRVLVATDVAARGLDVDGITHVFNFDLPVEAEAYVHRIGRTGRAGARGTAIAFCDRDERNLLRDIERLTGKRVPVVEDLPPLPERELLDRARGEYAGENREERKPRQWDRPRPQRDAKSSTEAKPRRKPSRPVSSPMSSLQDPVADAPARSKPRPITRTEEGGSEQGEERRPRKTGGKPTRKPANKLASNKPKHKSKKKKHRGQGHGAGTGGHPLHGERPNPRKKKRRRPNTNAR